MNNAPPQTLNKCTYCGKTIAMSTRGSLTAWLFRKAECNCESKNKDIVEAGDSELQTEGSSTSSLVGKLINDRYEVVEHIGSGGMASVYRVQDKINGQVYALKIISQQFAKRKGLDKRLEHEAEAVKTLTHANICAVYEFGRAENGSPFLVMDYVVGESLDGILRNESPLDENRVLNILIQVADALVYAHGRGVVHCDLKPSNVLVTKKLGNVELVKLVDFGIARISDQQNMDKTKLTSSAELVGSPAYMSPEQCRGEPVDGRSDIYSLACMIYELLSGKIPFGGENPVKVILKHLSEAPEPLPENISPPVREIVFRCMAKNADLRYQDAHALLVDALRVKNGQQLLPLKRKIKLFPSFRRFALAVPVAVVLIASGLMAISLLANNNSANSISRLNQSNLQAELRVVSESDKKSQESKAELLATRLLSSTENSLSKKDADTAIELIENALPQLQQYLPGRSLYVSRLMGQLESATEIGDLKLQGSYKERAARIVLEKFQVVKFDNARSVAADILSDYAVYLKTSGSPEWTHYQELAEHYRYNL